MSNEQAGSDSVGPHTDQEGRGQLSQEKKTQQNPNCHSATNTLHPALPVGNNPYDLDHHDVGSHPLFPHLSPDIYERQSIIESGHKRPHDQTKRRNLFRKTLVTPLPRRVASLEESSMWPENPFRSPANTLAASPDPGTATKSSEHHQDAEMSTTDATGDDTYGTELHAAEMNSARSPEADLTDGDADADLYAFFSDLAERLRKPEPTRDVLDVFGANPWFDHRFADKFGEEELRLLDQTLEVLVDREFLHCHHSSDDEARFVRDSTAEMLAIYRQRNLCKPHHWTTVLLRSSTALVRQRFQVWPAQSGEGFRSEIDILSKTRPLMRLWTDFFAAHLPSDPYSEIGLAPNGSLPHTALQESFYATAPEWPRGDNPTVDQQLFGAYVLMMTIYVRAVPATTLVSHSQTASSKSSQHTLLPLVSDSKASEASTHPKYECAYSHKVIDQIVRNIPSLTINTFWIRLVLAKISLTSEEAARVATKFSQAVEALHSGQKISLVGSWSSTLHTATNDLRTWLKEANWQDARQVSRLLVPLSTGIPRDVYSDLQSAVCISFLRSCRWRVAKAHLHRYKELFGSTGHLRKLCSMFLRTMYEARACDFFKHMWDDTILPFSHCGLLGVRGMPRFWFYYYLRIHWEKDPFVAFDMLRRPQAEIWGSRGLTESDYERLVRHLPLLAAKRLTSLFRRSPEILVAKAMTMKPVPKTQQRVCLLATRYALCLDFQRDKSRGEQLDLWLGQCREVCGTEFEWHVKQLVDLRVTLQLQWRPELRNERSVATLFRSSMTLLGDTRLDNHMFAFLRCVQEITGPYTKIPNLYPSAMKGFVKNVADISNTFREVASAYCLSSRGNVLSGLTRALRRLEGMLLREPDLRDVIQDQIREAKGVRMEWHDARMTQQSNEKILERVKIAEQTRAANRQKAARRKKAADQEKAANIQNNAQLKQAAERKKARNLKRVAKRENAAEQRRAAVRKKAAEQRKAGQQIKTGQQKRTGEQNKTGKQHDIPRQQKIERRQKIGKQKKIHRQQDTDQ